MKKIIIFLFAFIPAIIFSQTHSHIELGALSQYWILSENESSGDTLVFRPEGHEQIAEAHFAQLYGGWTFFPEGQVQKHRWRKCGVDGEPLFQPGTWKKKSNVMKIKVGKEQFLYQLVELNKELLKVIDLSNKK